MGHELSVSVCVDLRQPLLFSQEKLSIKVVLTKRIFFSKKILMGFLLGF
jgi:hypothetical protein